MHAWTCPPSLKEEGTWHYLGPLGPLVDNHLQSGQALTGALTVPPTMMWASNLKSTVFIGIRLSQCFCQPQLKTGLHFIAGYAEDTVEKSTAGWTSTFNQWLKLFSYYHCLRIQVQPAGEVFHCVCTWVYTQV